jgi:hypothetical protein
MVGEVQNEAGKHEEERDAKVAVLQKDCDRARHMGTSGKRSAEVERHYPEGCKETNAGQCV